MHNMDGCVKSLGQANQQCNRLYLRFFRARSKICGVPPPVRSCAIYGFRRDLHWAGNLSMGKQRQSGTLQLLQRLPQVGFVDPMEPIDARVNQKALEARNPGIY
jgi:hypothetical protein